MPWPIERQSVALVVIVSLALIGVTVWAVAEQGRALFARELADLRNEAGAAVAQRRALLSADLRQAFDTLATAADRGPDATDLWALGQAHWRLVAVRPTGADGWQIYPRTPLEQTFPPPRAATPAEAEESRGRDLLTLLQDLQGLASSSDPLTQAGALIAMAACEQQLGHPLAAARIFADAAQLLRSNPHLARFAFRAELDRIDVLLAAGDPARAREEMESLLQRQQTEQLTPLSALEITRLGALAEALGIGTDDPASRALAELRAVAAARADAATATLRALNGAPGEPLSPELQAVQVHGAELAGGEPWVVLARRGAGGMGLALAAAADALRDRYWDASSADEKPFVVQARAESGIPVLAELGPVLGDAKLMPSPATLAKLRALSRRHWGLVIATAVGTAGAWGLVIWLMTRTVARQRELAHLQSRFVADVSHELKTPLALIRLLSETLFERRVRDPERIRDYHETIARESERLTVLLDNILDVGRIESGRKRYEFGACHVADVARQAWTLFEPQFATEGFNTKLEIEPGLPVIRADGAALHQVLVNLLQNAYRYSGPEKYVRLAVAREGFVILITVEDHGIGMSRTQLRRLGESFFRAEDTRVRQQRGAGLGLAIVNHIVTAHGGKTEVQSRPERGTTFTVWIPFEPDN